MSMAGQTAASRSSARTARRRRAARRIRGATSPAHAHTITRGTTSMTTMTAEQTAWFAETFNRLADNIEKAVLGKRHVVKLALTCMLSEGHLLLEDFPGTGKTQLARAL